MEAGLTQRRTCECGAIFTSLPGVDHCSLTCAAAAMGYQPRSGRSSTPKANTTQRGYGADHRALRDALLPHAIGTLCPRCGFIMEADDDLDLGHTDDRDGYNGIEHAHCNRSAGAILGNEMRRTGT